MIFVFFVPLAFLCWVAWQALHREPASPLDLGTVAEAIQSVAVAIGQIPTPQPLDLTPLAEAIVALKPEPLDFTPVVQAIEASKPDPIVFPETDWTPIAAAMRDIEGQRERLDATLAPVLDRLLPQLHTLNEKMELVETRVATGPGKRLLRVP